MVRVSPDSNDILVHTLSDGPTTFANTGTTANADWTAYGAPVAKVPGPIPYNGKFNALYIPGSHISNVRNGAGGAVDVVPTQLSLSGWIFMRRYTSFFAEVFNKQYFLNSWSSPFLSFGFQMQNTNDGSIELYITVNGGLQVIRSANFHVVPLGRWSHIGGTWDGSTLRLYINGVLVNSSPFTGTITYASVGQRGFWYAGGIPGSSTNQEAPIIVQDVRLANIARPQSYFANIYRQSFLTGT